MSFAKNIEMSSESTKGFHDAVWTRDQLYDKAREVGIDGRSRMNKSELKRALRGS